MKKEAFNKLKNFLGWILGLLFGLMGLTIFFSEPASALALFAMSAILTPPILKWAEKRLNLKIPIVVKVVLILMGMAFVGSTVEPTKKEIRQSDEALIEEIRSEMGIDPSIKNERQELRYGDIIVSEQCRKSCVDEFNEYIKMGIGPTFDFETCHILCASKEDLEEMKSGIPEEKSEKNPEEEEGIPEPTPEPKEEAVQAVDLYNEYTNNEIAADEKYEGQELLITGTIQDIGKDILDDMYISLKTDDIIGTVQCMLADGEADGAAKLSNGQTITMSGENPDYLINVILRNCTIE